MRISHLRDGASICRAYRASDFGEGRRPTGEPHVVPQEPPPPSPSAAVAEGMRQEFLGTDCFC